jgi:hypothetical protein
MTDGVNPRRNRVESLRSTNVLSTLTVSQAAEIGRAIETSTHTGLCDRALLGVLAYTFARDWRGGESEGRRLLSFRETVFAPL